MAMGVTATMGAGRGVAAMRRFATGLLVVMAVIFFLARWAEDALHPGFGFVRAFAEAAMVGGLADWFAVTALFRHPLGLPIPHTAIIPRNKDRIGDTLAAFLRRNFLVPRVVARRMRRVNIAGALVRWLTDPPEGAGGRFRAGASKLVAQVLDGLDPERLGGLVKGAVAERLRAADVSPLLGQALGAAIAEGRHLPLMDTVLRWVAQALDANEHLIRQMIQERAGAILRWTGLDETLANKIIDGLHRLLVDVAETPEHPLRARVNESLEQLAWRLGHDEALRARVEAFKRELIANPAMQRWLDGMWEQARAALLRVARDPERAMAGPVGDMLRQLGTTLATQPALGRSINRFVRRAAAGTAADYGDGIVRLVSDTVRGWDARTTTDQLEQAVGRDLQYIRVNGTLVGGLVGLVIHIVDVVT